MNDDVLNGTVVMILFTCVISSLATDYFGRKLAVEKPADDQPAGGAPGERILIPVANPDTVENLVNLALVIKDPGTGGDFVALNVISDAVSSSMHAADGKSGLEKAARIATAADVNVSMVSRYDMNIASGIVHTIKEYSVSEVVIGLHQKSGFLDSFFGNLTNNLLRRTYLEVLVARFVMPVNTVKNMVVVVPPRAEYEAGFKKWLIHVCRMSEQLDSKVTFISEKDTVEQLRAGCRQSGIGLSPKFEERERLSLQEEMSGKISPEDVLVIVSARGGSVSYDPALDRIPQCLAKNTSIGNFIILYPEQVDLEDMVSFSDPMGSGA